MKNAVVIMLGLVLALSGVSFAGANAIAKVTVHVMEHASRRGCTNDFPVITDCDDIVVSLESGDADCFPVFYDSQSQCEFRNSLRSLDSRGNRT